MTNVWCVISGEFLLVHALSNTKFRHTKGKVRSQQQNSYYTHVTECIMILILSVNLCQLGITSTSNIWNSRNITLVYQTFLSLTEQKAHGWANSTPVTLASVCQHFQTSSPLKPLGQLNSNFILRPLRMQEQTACSNGSGHMTTMAGSSIYGKKPLKHFFSRTRRPMTFGLGM